MRNTMHVVQHVSERDCAMGMHLTYVDVLFHQDHVRTRRRPPWPLEDYVHDQQSLQPAFGMSVLS